MIEYGGKLVLYRADALDASHGVLRFFYFGSQNQAAHALFKLCDELDLYPSKKDAAIKPQEASPYRYAFVEWAQKREELAGSDATEKDIQSYKLWEAEFNAIGSTLKGGKL